MAYGDVVLMEKVEKTLDPVLIPLLDKQVYIDRGQKYIKLNESPCICKDNFRYSLCLLLGFTFVLMMIL